MLLVSDLRANIEAVKEKLGKRNFKDLHLVDDAIGLDDKRKLLQTNRDEILAKRNTLSKEIGQLFQSGKREEAESMKSKPKKRLSKKERREQTSQRALEVLHEFRRLL